MNKRLLDELQNAYMRGQIVLRTYLTSTAGYRRHIADGTASDDLKDALLALHLPHFTWITEIATIESYNNFSGRHAPNLRTYHHRRDLHRQRRRRPPGAPPSRSPLHQDVNAPPREQDRVAIIEGDDLYECRAKDR